MKQKYTVKIGDKSGMTTVISDKVVKTKYYGSSVHVRCECGNERMVVARLFVLQKIKSCGCLKLKRLTPMDVLLRNRHISMIRRCENPKSTRYNRYGGRGIKVCDEWKDFWVYRKWFLSEYEKRKSHPVNHVDRIDNNGNYEPSNCRLVSIKENARNKNTVLLINGKTRGEVLEERYPNYTPKLFGKFVSRLNRGMPVEKALHDLHNKNPMKSRIDFSKSTH